MKELLNKIAFFTIVISMLAYAVISAVGCAQVPATKAKISTASEATTSVIDEELERVNLMNEAYRKMKGMGCTRDTMVETDMYVDSLGINSYYEYECESHGGMWLKLRKFKDRWVIHGE
jgi:hypothetical protein